MDPRNTEGSPVAPGVQVHVDKRADTPCGQPDKAAAGNPSECLVGTVLDERYEILSRLGEGGMSVVYKARHKLLDKLVAIKVLHGHLTGNKEILQRFQQEARALSSLSHPNILSVSAFGVSPEGRLYLVMDLLEGRSLSAIIQEEGPPGQQSSQKIFVEVCDALAYAHAMGVIHRDLKPSNIIIVGDPEQEGQVKLVDFGIAKVLPQEGSAAQPLTQAGALFGSPPYMSPEQCLGQTPDCRSDIYSLGCLMYEVLTGRQPLTGDTALDTMYRQVSQIPLPFASVLPANKISPGMEAIVFRAMEKQPAKRYQNPLELKEDLLALSENILPQAAMANLEAARATGPRQIKLPRPSRALIPVSVLAALCLTALLSWTFGERVFFLLSLPVLLPHCQQQIAEAERSFGQNSPEHALASSRLADIYWSAGKVPESRAIYLKVTKLLLLNAALPAYSGNAVLKKSAVQIVCRALSDCPQDMIVAMERMGGEFQRSGDLLESRLFFERQLSAAGQLSDSRLEASALVHLGDLCLLEKDLDSAESYYRQALQKTERLSSADASESLAFVCEKLGECYLQEGKTAQAEHSFEQALSALPSATEAQRLNRVIFHLPKLERCYILQGKNQRLEHLLRQEIAVLEKLLPSQCENLKLAWHKLGDIYYRQNNWAQAEMCYRKELALAGTQLDFRSSLGTIQCLSDCLFYQSRWAQAAPLFAQELDYLEEHPHTHQNSAPLASLKFKLAFCQKKLSIAR